MASNQSTFSPIGSPLSQSSSSLSSFNCIFSPTSTATPVSPAVSSPFSSSVVSFEHLNTTAEPHALFYPYLNRLPLPFVQYVEEYGNEELMISDDYQLSYIYGESKDLPQNITPSKKVELDSRYGYTLYRPRYSSSFQILTTDIIDKVPKKNERSKTQLRGRLIFIFDPKLLAKIDSWEDEGRDKTRVRCVVNRCRSAQQDIANNSSGILQPNYGATVDINAEVYIWNANSIAGEWNFL